MLAVNVITECECECELEAFAVAYTVSEFINLPF
jgi:hypothetical protein